MNTEVMFSSKKMDWATPQDFYDKLDSEFHFTLDPCADESNYKCDKYFTEQENGFEQCWGGGRPYFAIRHTVERSKTG